MISTFCSKCGECRGEITTRCPAGSALGYRWHLAKLIFHLWWSEHEDQPTFLEALRELWRVL